MRVPLDPLGSKKPNYLPFLIVLVLVCFIVGGIIGYAFGF